MPFLWTILLTFGICLSVHAQHYSLDAVDIPPLFEGCNDPLVSKKQRQACSVPKIQAFIRQNITYPDSAKANNTAGVVVVRFVVDSLGRVSQLTLVRDIGDGCGDEAMRVVRMMPDFSPAMKAGKAVAAMMSLPIRFKKLEKENATSKYKLHWGTAYSNTITKEQLEKLTQRRLVVRDFYGEVHNIKYFTLKRISKNKIKEEETRGSALSKKMLKMLKRVKPHQAIVLTARIENNFQEIKVERRFIIKP